MVFAQEIIRRKFFSSKIISTEKVFDEKFLFHFSHTKIWIFYSGWKYQIRNCDD